MSLLAARYGVSDVVPDRETADADLGAEYPVLADRRLLPALTARGYVQVGGNRFIRDHAVQVAGDPVSPVVSRLAIDVLAPTSSTHLRSNQPVGALVVDEVPGLLFALARPSVSVRVEVSLSSGHELAMTLQLPDLVPAICMKSAAYAGRFSDRDAVDLWRLLEAAYAAGITAATWPRSVTPHQAARVLHRFFGSTDGTGPARASALPAHQTRIRALVRHVVDNADARSSETPHPG